MNKPKEPRKATDILLDVEDRLARMEAEIKLYNAGQAMILKKLNELASSSLAHIAEPTVAPGVVMVPEAPIQMETEFKGNRRYGPQGETKASNADITFKDYVAERARQKAAETQPSAAATQQNGKKFPVVQKIQDSKGGDLFMAEVLILNKAGELVAKVRTNAMGKWQAQLAAGNYSVKISKSESSTGKKVDVTQEIVVPANTNSNVDLKTLVVER